MDVDADHRVPSHPDKNGNDWDCLPSGRCSRAENPAVFAGKFPRHDSIPFFLAVTTA